jgi:hypothetical protein
MTAPTVLALRSLTLARIVNYLGRCSAVDGLVDKGVPPTEICFALNLDFDQCLGFMDTHCERPGRRRSTDLFVDYGECNFVLNSRAHRLFKDIQATCFMHGHRERILEMFSPFPIAEDGTAQQTAAADAAKPRH